jgi:hypothetical protein
MLTCILLYVDIQATTRNMNDDQHDSTCCRVHKNAELVPDSAGIRMYVRTTRQVRVDSEILVMYQPDRGFFGGVQGINRR